MAHGPDVISQSWHRVLNTPHCLVPPGRDQHQVGYSTQGPSTSKSSSPQQVKLQIHPGNEGQTASQHEQLLFGLPPDLKGGTANRTQTFSTESKPFGQRDYRNYGHVTAPSTPSGTRKTYGQVCEGKRSIVTYSYIEKANVRSVGDNNSTLFQNEPENLFRKAFNDQTIHFSKNVPSRFHRQEMISNSNEKKTLTGSVTNPQETSSLQLTMLHSNTKNATHQPLKQFGSPNLRQHLATANSPDQSYGTLHREQPRCHSWSGSPVVTRISKTLPVNAHLLDLNHRSHLHGITSRLTAHNLSSDAKQPYPMSFSNNGQSQAISSQQVWKSDETMRQGYRHCAIFSSSKSTASQDQIVNKTVTEPPHNQTVGQKTSPNPRPVNKDNCSLKLSSPTQSLSESLKADSTRSGHQSTQEFSTRTSSGTNFFAHEPHWEQKPGQTRYSTSFINLHKVGIMSTPTIQEPQQEREVSVGKKSPVSRQHQPPRYTDGNNIPSQEDNNFNGSYSHGFRESPDFMITRFVSTSKHHWKERHFSKWTGNTKKENLNAEESLVAPLVMDKESRNDSFVLSTKETYFIDPAHKDIRVEEEQNNALHQSSSGFTGSAVEVIQPERDAISPMTSSQNIQRSSDAQLDSGSSLLGPSLQCQRTARAKWEFLFGKPLEDEYRVTVPVSSFDPNGYSNGSPYEFTDSNSSDQPISNIPNTSSYDVQHLDMEPFNPPLPSAPDSSTKTGIIRRTIKYSETDLDAVPLRCYRETDIDEVILAEQEKINLAISNNRSVMATSDINSRKLFCSQTSEKEDQQYDDEITNRASVRRNCDKKRQQAVQDGDEVFSRLFEGSKNGQSDSFTAITAPVTVDSPSRSSTDDLDSFSRHFESIMESHRAKGTSYSSLDSEDIGSSGFPIFTFDFTTLTPEIQSQICKSAKQIVDLSFASLGQPETSSILTPSTSEALAGAEQCTSEEEHELTDRVSAENHISSESTKAMTQRERASGLVLQSDHVVAQRLALGRNDNIPNGAKADLPTAKLLAKRLYNLDGFRRSEIARHLGKNDNFSTMVAEEYLSYFNFAGMSVDQALRVFLREFALIGETQERERVLSHFSRRYLQCNPNTIPNLDSIHTLTCALMLLNTDLHGHNVGKRMSCTQFISNMEGLNGGQNFPKDLLKALYNSIKNEKLQWTIDEEDVRKSVSELADSRKDSASHTLRRITSGGAPLVSLAQQSNTQVHKKGFLVRKVHADPDGKRTPRGKRGWKTFYAILKGLVLYLQRHNNAPVHKAPEHHEDMLCHLGVGGSMSEYGAPKQLSHEDLKNAVSIHHSLAMKAADYSKRPNVFYLRTADWRIFLFQAPNAEQMQSWITRINTVAAMFSAPPFPAAIGSQKRFSRPLLPGSTTKLSQVEQMKSHEMHFRSVSTELQELRSVPRERKSKAKEQEETKQRDGYLEFEKTRYGTYAMLLRAKIRTRESDLTAFEACLFTDGTLQHTGSSPTLAHDTSHASASSCSSRSKKSSRSESQRHKPAVKQ